MREIAGEERLGKKGLLYSCRIFALSYQNFRAARKNEKHLSTDNYDVVRSTNAKLSSEQTDIFQR